MGSNLDRKPEAYSSKLYADRSSLKDFRKEVHRVKEFCLFGVWCLMEEIANIWHVACFLPDGITHLKGTESPKKTIALVRDWILDQKWTLTSK